MDVSDLRVTPVIGLEIHVQLLTATKMFCGCAVVYDAPPNSAVCPVCLGHPGALPVINRKAFELGMTAGLALGCDIGRKTKWDRKSYYYPDMPKNYQISQYDMPLCLSGRFTFPSGDATGSVRIRRAHLEEDAGKNIHEAGGGTLVDLNRAGTPLLEIVTEPDLHSADDTHACCTELQRLLVYLGVTEGVMKKGQMRFEPNVNLHIEADGVRYETPIAEIKNLNSFKAVRQAVAYDIERQLNGWRQDRDYVRGKAPNENRGFNDDTGVTEFQRPKEAAHDYRYFPDPDLVPARVTETMLDEARAALPELPRARAARFVETWGLDPRDVDVLTADRHTADAFEAGVEAGAPADMHAKQFVNVWQKLAADRETGVHTLGVDARAMAGLTRMAAEGVVNKSAVTRIAEAMVESGDTPEALAESLGLLQVNDSSQMEEWVDKALEANREALEDARKNPKKVKAVAGFLRGQVMKLSGGRADPRAVGELITARLDRLLAD